MQAVRVTVVIEREGDAYSAVCLEMGVSAQGATIDEAKQNIHDAILLYLETCREQGMSLEECWHPVPEELRAGQPIQRPYLVRSSDEKERWTGELLVEEQDRDEAAAAALV